MVAIKRRVSGVGALFCLCLPLLAVACGGSDDDDSSGNGAQTEISSEAENVCQRECDESFTECVLDQDACLSDCREDAAWYEEHCESAHVAFSACQAAKSLSEYMCLDTHASAAIAGCDDEYDALDTCMEPYR
jgi:hypothetical protein